MTFMAIRPEQLIATELFDIVQERTESVKNFRCVWKFISGKRKKFLLRSDEHGITLPVELEETCDGFRICFRGGTVAEETPRWRLMRIQVLPGLMDSPIGSEGNYLLPIWSGALVDFRERPYTKDSSRIYLAQKEWEKFSSMNCFGSITPAGGFFTVVEGGDFHALVESEYNDNGINHLYLTYLFRDKKEDHLPMEDFSATYHILPKGANYGDCAILYRQYFLEKGVGLLRDRAENNPELAYSIDAMRTKIYMADKAPTPDGSAPVTVHADCKDSMKIIDAMKEAGIEKAMITLVGWNFGGHDGAYPRHFPVEPAIGGEEGLRELIGYAKQSGYRIVPHDNCTDIYRSSEEFFELVARHSDGAPVGGCMWSGGFAYNACPLAFIRRSGREFERIKDLGFQGHYYMDAQSTPLFCCDAPNHPANEKEFALTLCAMTEIPRALYGAISVENILPYTIPYVDECGAVHCPEQGDDRYKQLPENLQKLEPYPVPVYAIALHGLILMQRIWVHHYRNVHRGQLQELAFGFRPCIEVSSRNNGGNGGDYQKCIAYVQKAASLCFKELKLQTVLFESFAEPVRGFYDAKYENGIRIQINTTAAEYDSILANSYRIFPKGL